MVDLVLIDDDVLIHGVWKMVARLKNHNLVCFSTIQEFLKQEMNSLTPVYIDYHFNNGENGMDLAKILFEKGYKNLYITTGSKLDPSEKPQEVLAIVGKDYPL